MIRRFLLVATVVAWAVLPIPTSLDAERRTGAPAEDGGGADGPGMLSLDAVPPRPENARTGTELASATAEMSGRERQRVMVEEILRGNVPSFVRLLRPISLHAEGPAGERAEAVVWVTPDYLAVGSDDDFLRMPLTWPSATRIARAFGCVLPTTRIVDRVWAEADRRLEPAPLPPGPRMRSSEYYLRHRALIEGDRGSLASSTLIAGHKKDVVLSGRLTQKRNRIAIYGWHRSSGEPIQPLSTVHGARYADYSHGIRLVWGRVRIDGETLSIYDALASPASASLLSDEGPLPTARALMRPEL